ncbi:MAG: hypothetical protein ACE5FZ_06685 [Nitrospiria bacterium]
MKRYSKLQILEAGETLFKLLQVEGYPVEYLTAVNCIIEDLVDILTGKIRPIFTEEHMIIPGIGFVPLVGEIVTDQEQGNRVEWFADDEPGEGRNA